MISELRNRLYDLFLSIQTSHPVQTGSKLYTHKHINISCREGEGFYQLYLWILSAINYEDCTILALETLGKTDEKSFTPSCFNHGIVSRLLDIMYYSLTESFNSVLFKFRKI